MKNLTEKTCAVVLLLVVCFIGKSECLGISTEADSLYQIAITLPDTISITKKLDAFNKIVELYPKYALAYHELAKLYMSINSLNGRRQAERAIKSAIGIDSHNDEFQLTLGDVMWAQGQQYNALNQYEKVLDRYPGNVEILYKVGRQAVEEFLKYWDMVNRETMESGFLLRLRPFAEKDRQKAIEFLNRCIDLNPGYRDAYYMLGLVYQESRQPADLIHISEQLLVQVPNDRDALLFCALGYQTIGEYKTADEFYQRALEQMNSRDRIVMDYETVDLIKEKNIGEATGDDLIRLPLPKLELDSPKPKDNIWRDRPEDARFWRQQDPLFLTDYNERRMIHYGRVAYANLRFGWPSHGVAGWMTDTGKTWIKFGRYIHRETVWGSSEEVWFYEGFRIKFFNGHFSGPTRPSMESLSGLKNMTDNDPDVLFQKASHHTWMEQPQLSSQAVYDRQKPRFVDPYMGQKYTIPHQVAAFRDKDSVRVEISYVIPRTRLKYEPDEILLLADGLFVFDTDWEETYKEKSKIKLSLPSKPERLGPDNIRAQYVLSNHTVYVQPGRYHIAAEVADLRSETVGTFRETYIFTNSDTLLAMSDLLLACAIVPLTPIPMHRRDLKITPNPLRTYNRSEPISVYFEIYNLTRDTFGQTKYDISYHLGLPDKKDIDPALFDAQDLPQGKLVISPHFDESGATNYDVQYKLQERNQLAQTASRIRNTGNRIQTTVSAEYEGDQTNDFTFLEIDVSHLPVGIFKLTVTVVDRNKVGQVVNDIIFRIID